MLYHLLFSNRRVATCTYFYTSYLLRFINLEYIKSDKNHLVSQIAHAKNIGEPFMARAKNLYNIPRLAPTWQYFGTITSDGLHGIMKLYIDKPLI